MGHPKDWGHRVQASVTSDGQHWRREIPVTTMRAQAVTVGAVAFHAGRRWDVVAVGSGSSRQLGGSARVFITLRSVRGQIKTLECAPGKPIAIVSAEIS